MPYKDLTSEKARAAARAGSARYRERHPGKQAEFIASWRAANPEKVQASNDRLKGRMAANREIIGLYKQILGCMDCGEHFIDRPECLDFDHRPGTDKRFQISDGNCWAWENVISEVEKCDVVCANCHRTRTVNRKRSLP